MTWAWETIGTASKAKRSMLLPGGSLGFGQMGLDAPTVSFGDLVLGEAGQEAGSRPAFAVSARRCPAGSA